MQKLLEHGQDRFGNVYKRQALNESGKLTVKGLKKATKLKEKELYAALGWLAREGKVSMYEVDADIEVVLL